MKKRIGRRRKATRKGEMFSVGVDGAVTDKWVHDEILGNEDKPAVTEIGKAVARRAGLSEAEIKKLYEP